MSDRLEEVKFNLETGGHITYEDRRWLISEVETLRAQLATARDAALEEAAELCEALDVKWKGEAPPAAGDVCAERIRALKGKGR